MFWTLLAMSIAAVLALFAGACFGFDPLLVGAVAFSIAFLLGFQESERDALLAWGAGFSLIAFIFSRIPQLWPLFEFVASAILGVAVALLVTAAVDWARTRA